MMGTAIRAQTPLVQHLTLCHRSGWQEIAVALWSGHGAVKHTSILSSSERVAFIFALYSGYYIVSVIRFQCEKQQALNKPLPVCTPVWNEAPSKKLDHS